MSAVVGDVGQIGSLFAGLAAIVTLFLFGASASRMRAKSEEPPQSPKQSHCHSLRRNMRAQDLQSTNGYQATLLATVQSANPMGCVAQCENYRTSAEMLTVQFLRNAGRRTKGASR